MKIRYVIGAIALGTVLYASPALAQVGGGIKVGVNLASIGGFNDPGSSTSQRTGLVAGVFVTAQIAPVIAFQPEVLYSMQGSKLHFSDSGVQTDATAKLDYLQIPLLLRIGNTSKSAASLYGLVGPSFGLLMRADQDGENIKPSLKRVDAGLAVGAGVSLSRMLVEGRYTTGLTDLNKVRSSDSPKNRVISIFIGLVF